MTTSTRKATLALAVAVSGAAAVYGLWRWGRRRTGCLGDARALLRFLENDNAAEDECGIQHCSIAGVQCQLVVKHKNQVLQKLRAMVNEGVDNFEIITDFDHTLSRFQYNGRTIPSTHSILESYPFMTDEDRVYFRSLYSKYYPIEICHSTTDEEKLPLMIEWWQSAHTRLIDIKIQQSVLATTVDQSGVMLRAGWRQFFDAVTRMRTPCLIFSAGIGDIIQEILHQFHITASCIRVVSNFMIFDDNNVLSGFTDPIIHSMNKRAAAFVTGSSSHSGASSKAATAGDTSRRNILLMGDTLGDLRMSEGCNAQRVLSVGYLNDKVQQRLPSYSDNYDIVCVQDSTLTVPLCVLGAMESES